MWRVTGKMTDGSEGMRGRYRDRGSRTDSKQICYWKRVQKRDRTLVNDGRGRDRIMSQRKSPHQ